MAAGLSPRAERLAFLLVALVAFLYVVLRAVKVPIVHDEAMTFFMYVETGRFLPFRSFWDAGNHLLCTALGWGTTKLFGQHLFALRLPSVLAFLLYAFYTWRWGWRLRDRVVRWCFWMAMLGMPFLLDFFSLFRGYGMAMAFWLMALYELCALLERPSMCKAVLLLLAMAAATYSALSLLSLWAVVLLIVAVLALHRRQRAFAGPWLALGVLPFLFAVLYMHRLSMFGALYYGLETGVVGGTVPSLLHVLVGSGSPSLTAFVVLAYAAAALAALRALRLGERTFAAWVLMMGAGMLLADALGRIVLHAWDGTPFPEDRTALQWVPLFMLLAAFALDRAARRMPVARWAVLPLLVLPARTVQQANLQTTSYWPEQAIPEEVFSAAAEQQRGGGPELLTIGAYHQMQACWGFGLRQHGLRLNSVDFTDFPDGGQDLLLLDPARMELPPGYRMLVTAPSGQVALAAREDRQAMELVLDTLVGKPPGGDEFWEIWHPAVEEVRGHAFRVAMELVPTLDHPPLVGSLVVEVNVGDATTHRNEALLQSMRNTADPDSLVTVRAVPQVPPDADRVVVYLWNWHRRQTWSVTGARLRVYRMLGD